MKNLTWFVTFIVMPFTLGYMSSCNAEKRVLDSDKKTQNVVNAWLISNPVKVDTTFRYIPGDTATTLLISYDTTAVHDTATNTIEKVVTKIKTITNSIHDTIKVTIGCAGASSPCAMLKAAQDGLIGKSAAYDQQVLETGRQRLTADEWRFRFWLLISIIGLLISVVVGIKLFKPSIKI